MINSWQKGLSNAGEALSETMTIKKILGHIMMVKLESNVSIQ